MSMNTDVPPSTETRTISLDELIKAMALNGYDQGFGHLLDDTVPIEEARVGQPAMQGKKYRIVTACAYGQAALNLGVDSQDLTGENQAGLTSNVLFASVYHRTFKLNDMSRFTPKQIARRIKAEFKEKLKETITVPIAFYEEIYSNYQGRKI